MDEESKSSLRQRILEEAARLFVTQGYDGISMREIAEAVGVSKAGLYYHFRDKEDLLLAVLTAYLDEVERLIQEARRQNATAREQVAQFLRGIFAQPLEKRAIIRLASQEMAHLHPETRAAFGRLYREKFIAQVEAILQEGVDRGELALSDVRLATWMLLGMAYPFFYPAHAREMGPPDQAIALMISLFFDGAARRGQRMLNE
ncbi:MAG: TetR/AcrR family transcriptional regulator [Chloroflexi bacterium]|nr:MAG: TetR/AcrR family transcriptional regulator [Chloroflexota bacterium]